MHPAIMNEEGVLQIKSCGSQIQQSTLNVLQFVQILKLMFHSNGIIKNGYQGYANM